MASLKHRLSGICYPEIRLLPKQVPFDSIELVGMATGLILVTTLTSYVADGLSVGARIARGLANFVVAVPLLALALGPFSWRRTRRGLRIEIERLLSGKVQNRP
jgi:hypothetical protein